MGLFTLLSFAIVGCALTAPHHHHHHIYKTVYLGGEGGEVSDSQVAGGGELSVSASLGGGGGIGKHEVISEKIIDVELPAQPEIKAQKTVIERTVVPQYVEKTIRVPSYVEKTVRVPTYVTKTVKVPIQPSIVEKTISHEDVPVPASQVKVAKGVSFDNEVVSGHGAGGGLVVGGATHSGGLFDSIFNIPVQTLGAVNGLLNNLSGRHSGGGYISGGFSKGYSAY